MNEKTMKKYAIIGGSSSGKTTLISALEAKGYDVLPEVGRDVLNERFEYDPTPEEWTIRQRIMFDRKIGGELEKQLSEGICFCDRGLYDNIAYSKYLIGRVDVEFPSHFERYEKVFSLNGLPFVKDGTRFESGQKEVDEITSLIEKEYFAAGYELIRVPIFSYDGLEDLSFEENIKLSVENRIKFIEGHIND